MKTAPLYMPEFDRTFSWAMCRNTMCANFGIPYAGALSGSGKPAEHDDHYRLDEKNRLHCKYCKQSFELKSNIAVRPIARYYLSLSLPFATCPDDTCENHGYNVFEHYFVQTSPYRSKRRYRRGDGDHNTTCTLCKRQFAIGEPLRIGTELTSYDEKRLDKKIEEHFEAIIEEKFKEYLMEYLKENPEEALKVNFKKKLKENVRENFKEKVKLDIDKEKELRKIRLRKQETVKTLSVIVQGVIQQRKVIDSLSPQISLKHPISSSSYYARLKQVGTRLRDYHSWRNARLLSPRNGIKRNTPMRVYTDVLQVSLQRLGVGRRYQFLNIIVSVLELEKSTFTLAAHPYFYPETEKDTPSEEDLIDSDQFGFHDDWDCLNHPGKSLLDEDMDDTDLPDIGRGGYFICSPYAEAAHFMVVDKMLRRFNKVYYYMDAARDLYPAALCALAEPVRSGRVEIALFQHEKVSREEGIVAPDAKLYTADEKAALLDTAFRDMEARFDSNASPKKGELLLTTKQDNRVRAGLYKGAVKGGRSKKGGWAWLHYPPDDSHYYDCLTLWLTRMPDKTFGEHGKPLLHHATLKPVDSIMNSMRDRVRAMSRPDERAKPGRSYKASSVSISPTLGEMWVYLLARNYRRRSIHKPIPAHKLGLMTEAEEGNLKKNFRTSPIENDFAEIALDFRLGLNEAGKMSHWLR